jgi:hypothetical protein
MSTVTNGVGCISRINITSSATTLVLVGASQRLTYQITAEATDNFGNVIEGVELYYNIVAGNDVAEVTDDGLVTATGAGQAVIQVSAAAFGNTINLFTPAGVPINAVYAEQAVSIVEGVPELPDFSFTLDQESYTVSTNGTFSITITQTALNGFTGDVAYTLRTNYNNIYPWRPSFAPNQPFPTISFAFYTPYGGIPITIAGDTTGTITGGSGTLTLSFQAQDAPAGTIPLVINGFYPPWGATGANAGPISSHNVSTTVTVS